ncbi:hypothetical protein SY83_11050 [Paenibacillus swuensis]|uniref:DUF1871 domain-containing protein n=1 Tax=Paenibacillus swuensis TaxID=1178515 RepID=A0A172TI83_9BACL|nr:DUF1871 family protein [Paenibacillus swuensis]ANE46720.1 hypothetical protein SY83_11050 [Paenibacillus swuensis]
MRDIIIQIINEWNPVDIYPLLKDEYYSESQKVFEAMDLTSTANELAKEMFNIFVKSFGKEFNKSMDECRYIAKKIINSK